MTEKVVKFPGLTSNRVPPENVLKGALKADLEEVVVAGYTKDGSLYFASSPESRGAETLRILALAQKVWLDDEIGSP